jgi:ABC-2 type transport system ATP-binding protein
MSAARKKQRIDAVVELCALGSVIGKAIGKLSKGYRQRVGMAQVLLHEPEVLILDEPTAGLDPNQIREVRETIRRLGEEKTLLISTHIMQEVEAIAKRVLFINEGRLVYDGTPNELISEGRTLDEQFHRLTALVPA